MEKDYCVRCKFLDKRYNSKGTNRLPFCDYAMAFLDKLKCCPLKSDDCFK